MTAPAHPTSHAPTWWHHLQHHAVVAAVVASLVGLLHQGGFLGWLDSATLRLLGSASPALDGTVPAHLPQVLLVGPELYETTFRQASPLDRPQLARLLTVVARTGPAVLAVDLDLSPGPDGQTDGQVQLDEAIAQAARSGLRIVLTLPFRVAHPALRAIKFQWLQRMCALPGVELALSDVVTHSGMVLQFDRLAPSMGVVAERMFRQAPQGNQGLCPLVRQAGGESADFLLAPKFDESMHFAMDFGAHLSNFNAEFFTFAHRLRQELAATDALPTIDGRAAPDLRGRVVFLGGAYNPADRFLLPLATSSGRADGAEVHAAVYASMRTPVNVVKGALAFLLDIAIGIAAAFLFAWSWRLQLGQRDRWIQTGSLASYAAARSLWLANLTLLAVCVLGLALLARSVFFPGNLWINPGPIAIGVFIKFMLANRHAAQDDAAPPGPALVRWVERAILVLIVAAGVAAAVGHH